MFQDAVAAWASLGESVLLEEWGSEVECSRNDLVPFCCLTTRLLRHYPPIAVPNVSDLQVLAARVGLKRKDYEAAYEFSIPLF